MLLNNVQMIFDSPLRSSNHFRIWCVPLFELIEFDFLPFLFQASSFCARDNCQRVCRCILGGFNFLLFESIMLDAIDATEMFSANFCFLYHSYRVFRFKLLGILFLTTPACYSSHSFTHCRRIVIIVNFRFAYPPLSASYCLFDLYSNQLAARICLANVSLVRR